MFEQYSYCCYSWLKDGFEPMQPENKNQTYIVNAKRYVQICTYLINFLNGNVSSNGFILASLPQMGVVHPIWKKNWKKKSEMLRCSGSPIIIVCGETMRYRYYSGIFSISQAILNRLILSILPLLHNKVRSIQCGFFVLGNTRRKSVSVS